MQGTSFDKENTVSNKTYKEIYEEIKDQVYKNTGSYPSADYVYQWIKEHNLWKQPHTIKQEDLDKLYIVEQHLDEGVILYHNEKVESIYLVSAMGDATTLEDLLEMYEYEPIPQSSLDNYYLSIYIDNPEKFWIDIEPSELDKFIEQIDNSKKVEK